MSILQALEHLSSEFAAHDIGSREPIYLAVAPVIHMALARELIDMTRNRKGDVAASGAALLAARLPPLNVNVGGGSFIVEARGAKQ